MRAAGAFTAEITLQALIGVGAGVGAGVGVGITAGDALHAMFVPPFRPLHDQFHGPKPATAGIGVPAKQSPAPFTDAESTKVPPLAGPQMPFSGGGGGGGGTIQTNPFQVSPTFKQ